MNSSPIKITAFTAYPWDNALPILRLLNSASSAGVEVIKGNDFVSGAIWPEKASQASIIYIQRDFPRFQDSHLRIKEIARDQNIPIIYEIDDLLFEPSHFPTVEEYKYYRPAIGLMLDALVNADSVITSTPGLKAYIEKFNPKCVVFPNYLNEKEWKFEQPKNNPNGVITVGYVGTRSHIPDIEALAPLVSSVYEKYKNQVIFQLWIQQLPCQLMSYRNVHWTPVSIPDYPAYIKWFSTIQPDIWIAPLLNTPFNAVKSPIKFLEYSAKGIPGVYSRVNPYQNVITHGENGLLAGTSDEWINALEELIDHPELRNNIGQAAQQTVQRDWLMGNHSHEWLSIIQNLVGQGHHTPEIKFFEEAFARLNHIYTELGVDNRAQEKQLTETDTVKTGQEDLLLERAKKIDEQQNLLIERSRRIDQLENSFMTKAVTNRLRRLRLKLAPPKSRRLRYIKQTLGLLTGRGFAKPVEVIPAPAHQPNLIYTVNHPIRLALYTTDNWGTASAHIRLVGPSNHPSSGIRVLDGTQADGYPLLNFYINADAVVIQRDFPRHTDLYARVIQWADQTHKPVLYEIDDVLFDLPADHPEKGYFKPFEDAIANGIRQAHAVITTTQPLAARLAQLNPNAWVLPNYLDDQVWQVNQKPETSQPAEILSIGYMGGITQTHLPDIMTLAQTLKNLLREHQGKIALHFWGLLPPEFNDLPGVCFHNQRFPNYKDFAHYFAEQKMDLFLAPLIENQFNDCKSAIKFLEYSSLGVPGIYSGAAPYLDVVNHGENGFIADSPSDWQTYLHKLIEDPALRQSVGMNAFNTVERLYLLSRHAQEWQRIYESAIIK